MFELALLFCIAQMLVVMLALSVGKTILRYKIKQEENRRKELELDVLDKRAQILEEGKKIAVNLEDLLYRAKLSMEIDGIIRKDSTR